MATTGRMTVAAFLAWEEHQAVRHEFDGFKAVALTGGTLARATVQSNLAISVGGRLRGTPCRFLGRSLRVVTATTSRYPDGIVSCTVGNHDSAVAPAPVVIFEILGFGTAGHYAARRLEYATIPSVQRYVLLAEERISATVFARVGERWLSESVAEDGILGLPELGVEVPLAELYSGLDQPDILKLAGNVKWEGDLNASRQGWTAPARHG